MMFSYDKKIGTSVLHKIYWEATLLPWQLHNECHFILCLIYITSAKFEEQCFYISKDILDFVIFLSSEPLMTSPVFTLKLDYLPKEKQYFKNENSTLLLFQRPSKSASFIFYFIEGTLLHCDWLGWAR